MPYKDPVVAKEKKRKHYLKNRKRLRAGAAKRNSNWYQKNKDVIRVKQAVYRKNNAEKVAAYQKVYSAKHRDKKKKIYVSKIEEVQAILRDFNAFKRRQSWDSLAQDFEKIQGIKRAPIRKIRWRILRHDMKVNRDNHHVGKTNRITS